MIPETDRDLLVRIDERVSDLHMIIKGSGGLADRVNELESAHDKAKGWAGAVAALYAGLLTLGEYLLHRK